MVYSYGMNPMHSFLSISLLCSAAFSVVLPAKEAELGEQAMVVIGEVEWIGIAEAAFSYSSRIDTGATTCSIHAENIKGFERDGDKWVRFDLVDPNGEERKTLEKRVQRVAEIKRHGAEAQKRYVVNLHAVYAGYGAELEFSLTDRSAYTYPLLVGRNLLRGTAMVDVSLKNTLAKPEFKKK